MSVHKEINDLPAEILCFILEFLSSGDLNNLKTVNKQWQGCVHQILSKRIIRLKRQKNNFILCLFLILLIRIFWISLRNDC